ncbi:MAG: MBL fold metallo-hydrolase [Planctomycetota bacterium]
MIEIVYDNYERGGEVRSAWGFSCVVEGGGPTVLFDTGGDGEVLLHNMAVLDRPAGAIDCVVLSHNHWDHIGGLEDFLSKNGNVEVYMPSGFPSRLRELVHERGGEVVDNTAGSQISADLLVTPVWGDEIEEEGLLVREGDEWILLTGCAHPGITRMVGGAEDYLDKDVNSVIGGFHMKDDWNTAINRTVADLRMMGVTGVGPCHCSGDAAREKMKLVFGENYLDVGIGTEIGG